jgi:hypothetical protein
MGLLRGGANFLAVGAALYAAWDSHVEFHPTGIRYARLLALPVILGLLWVLGRLASGPRLASRAIDALVFLGLCALVPAFGIYETPIFWISDPAGFALHSALMGLMILVVALVRSRWASVLAIAVIAVAVLLPQAFRPQVELWRSAVPWALVIAWAWARTRGPGRPAAGVLVAVVLALGLGMLPLKAGRYVPPTAARAEAIRSQAGVEVLFLDDADPRIPAFRKEMLCDPFTGALVVTPHDGSTSLAQIQPDGEVQAFDLPDEACDASLLDGPLLLTGLGGNLAVVDLQTRRIATEVPLCRGRVYYISPDPARRRLVVSCGDPNQCFVLEDGPDGWVSPYDPLPGEQCLFVDDTRVLVSPELVFATLADHWQIEPGNRGKALPAPFHQVFADLDTGRVFYPMMLTGEIQVRDLETLDVLATFQAERGVRGVLLDPLTHQRVFSWNYATGLIHLHSLPEGTITRSWDVGPILRNLRWDCDGTSLLAVSSQGGFRIRP